MKFIFQDSFLPDEREKLIPILKENGIDYSIIKTTYESDLIGGETIVLRSSIEFFKEFSNLFGDFIDLHHTTWNNYLWSRYTQHFDPYYLLNKKYSIWPWHSLSNPYLISTFLKNYSERVFIRPNDGEKTFTGTTLRAKWWDKELEIIKSLPGNERLTDDTLVVMSDFKDITAEARCVMYQNTMLDFSFYTENTIDKSSLLINSFVIDDLNLQWWPDDFWTLDIAFRGLVPFVLEINSAWSAGWYDCNYELIVNKILELENESN